MALPDNVAAAIDGYEARGECVPERYQRPDVLTEAQPFLTAFLALQYDRSSGFGPGPIPFTAIDRYANRLRIVGDEFWLLESMVRACDSEWLKHASEKTRKGGKGRPGTVSSEPLTAERFDALFG